jgi:hypothetical protein
MKIRSDPTCRYDPVSCELRGWTELRLSEAVDHILETSNRLTDAVLVNSAPETPWPGHDEAFRDVESLREALFVMIVREVIAQIGQTILEKRGGTSTARP